MKRLVWPQPIFVAGHRLDPYFQRRRNKRVGHCGGRISPFSPRTRASLPRRSAPYRETFVAHSRLYPGLTGDRWMTTLLLVVSPPAGSRAHAWVVRDCFARFHPVAVARALGTRDTLTTLAEQAWRDRGGRSGPPAAEAKAAHDESRSRLSAQLRRLVQPMNLMSTTSKRRRRPKQTGLRRTAPVPRAVQNRGGNMQRLSGRRAGNVFGIASLGGRCVVLLLVRVARRFSLTFIRVDVGDFDCRAQLSEA